MNEQLATELLIKIMDWNDARVASERPYLEALARFKYNEYQQFAPGMRFIESLALWLRQFATSAEREHAYAFVKERLIFVSSAEMTHYVSVSFPDLIRPILVRRAASTLGTPSHNLFSIITSVHYSIATRQCLFLGLSDGARLDIFRRFNPQLSHDQIYRTHEISEDRAQGLKGDLVADLREHLGREPTPEEARFTTVVLIDDFTASGLSFLRTEVDAQKGKFSKWLRSVAEDGDLADLIAPDAHIAALFYIATASARTRLSHELPTAIQQVLPDASCDVIAVQELDDSIPLAVGRDDPFLQLVDDDRYYNTRVNDVHMATGTGDGRRGFDEGLLPVVLTHNTPNNSVLLLWANSAELGLGVRGLFPRVSRHRAIL